MTGRVLVIDDVPANVKLLEARLSAEYFDVLTASSGPQALTTLAAERIDVILLDVMMPGMDGYEVCRRIKAAPATMHVPVVMVSALDQTTDKVRGLEAGADDFLTKPVDDIALITRVKNLSRLKLLNDEMLLRMDARLGFSSPASIAAEWSKRELAGRILLVEDQEPAARRVLATLQPWHRVLCEPDAATALAQAANLRCDLVIVSLDLAGADGLRVCAQLRALEKTRALPIIVLVHAHEEARLLRALDMGVNDYLTRPLDRNELLARVRTQIRRKRHCEHLRGRLEESFELALTDPLTGLFNRRYLETHIAQLLARARNAGQLLSLLMVDIDNFKCINDSYGHEAGDGVLRQFASRVRRAARSIDLACRVGGEEFVIVLPELGGEDACRRGESLRALIAAEPFALERGRCLAVTASVGVATLGDADTREALFKRADRALYAAKRAGRNRVVAHAA